MEKEIREKMQVLEGWIACAEDGLIREAANFLHGLYRLKLREIEIDKRFPGEKPKTSMEEPGYWQEKQAEMRFSGEDRYTVPEAI